MIRIQQLGLILVCFGCLAGVGGCRTIREARQAQAELAAKGAGEREAPCDPEALKELVGAPLKTYVDFALAHRPSLQAARLAVTDARLALKEIEANAPLASTTPWGGVDVGLSVSYSEASPSAHFSDLGGTVRADPSAGLSLNLLIYDFGRNAARAKAQTERVLAAELALVEEGYSVFNEVSDYYFTLLESDAMLEVAHTNVVKRQEQLDRAKLQFEHGLVQELDVLRAELDLTEAEEDVVLAQGDVAVAETKLMAALGIKVESGLPGDIVGGREETLGRVLRAFPESTLGAPEAFQIACTNAPGLKIARAKLRAASASVDAAIADTRPELAASLALNWTDPLWYWRWGLSATQSLFSGGSTMTAIDRAVVQMQSAAAEVDRAENLLSADIQLAITTRDKALEYWRTVQKNLKESRRNLETVTAQYEVGDASRVDCTEAITDYVEQLGNRVRAFYRAQAAEAKLFQLKGCEPVYAHEWIVEDYQ